MSRIQQLDASIINKIAAGEVIERPANVVKELLENSVDALATRIEVDIVEGGAELIRISDNGEGIHPDDILLAVSSHATSKIRTAEDLFRVQTMGFRGEALASIAEVSDFRIRSRQQDALAGTEMIVNCGSRSDPEPCGCPPGTTIEIRNLFASTPVRRKFMRTKSTEFGHISEQFTRVALANPRLHMTLRHNNKVVFDLPPVEQLIERLKLFYGNALTEQLIYVESEAGDVRISGYVAHPSQSKGSRKWQHLFLNGRWFQDRAIQHSLTEAYRGLLMVGRQPIAFLFIDMPATEFDVNVHPTKVEVRFIDSQHLYRQTLSMVRTKFLSMDLDSEFKLKSEPATAAESAAPKEMQAELTAWAEKQSRPGSSTAYSGSTSPLTTWSVGDPVLRASLGRDNELSSQSIEPRLPESRGEASVVHLQREQGIALTERPAGIEGSAAQPQCDDTDRESAAQAGSVNDAAEPALPNGSRPAEIHGDARAMQILDCYLVVDSGDGLMVIDQHALHERIMYEYLRPRVLNGSVESQRMLIPETIELTAREASLLLEHRELLAKIGFGIEEFGTGTVLINAHPAMLRKVNLPELFRDVAEQLEVHEKKPSRRDLLDDLLHMMSCKAAIKAGQRLAPEEISSLLEQRHLIDDAHHCPHGRPTALVLTQAELDKQFGRLG